MLIGLPDAPLDSPTATSPSTPMPPWWSVMFVALAAAGAAGAGVAATAGVTSPPAAAAGGAPSAGAAALSCANALPEPPSASPRAEQNTKRTVRFVIFLLRLTSRPPPTHTNRAPEMTPGGGHGRDY